MTTTLETLRAARELIAKPGGWTQEFFARNASGERTNKFGPDAVCFCAYGAIDRAAGHSFSEADRRFMEALFDATGRDDVADWNDAPGRTQAEVVALFDKAIAAEETRNV